MKLKIGERYKISQKLKNAFGVNEDDAKIISISGGIVMLQIAQQSFPLKEIIALTNLSTTYVLTAHFNDERKKKDATVNDAPIIEPIEEPVIEEPVVEPKEEIIPEEVIEPEPEEVIEPEPEVVVPDPDINNSITITVPIIEEEPEVIEEEPEVIEEDVQDNTEPEPEPTPEPEPEFNFDDYNPDEDWGM